MTGENEGMSPCAKAIYVDFREIVKAAQKDGIFITDETAAKMAISAFIDTHGRTGGSKSGGAQGAPQDDSADKPYERWAEPMSEGQRKFLHAAKDKIAQYLMKQGTPDPMDAGNAIKKFMMDEFRARFKKELPEKWDGVLTKGEAMFLLDRMTFTWPELFPPKKEEGK